MWEQIRANKRTSAFLIVLVAAILFALGYFMAEAFAPGSGPAGLVIAFVVWIILSLTSYYAGDGIFLSLAGARKIEKQDLPVLYNVVEEMTIASGLKKIPDIYIVDDPAPNAFATGRDPEHASVAVTSGLLRLCNRDELQGVVAHELGHVRNRDTLLMLIAGIMVGCIIMLADLGRRWMWWGGGRTRRSRGRGGGQAQLVILAIALILMIIGPIAAQLLYFAISRRREYLADASSALYTRYPEGLASALEKLADYPGTVAHATRATAPMYIINPLQREGLKAADLTSTHPPISERVRVLRSMAGASFADYGQAFQKVNGRTMTVLPAQEGGALAKRAPLAAGAAVPGGAPGQPSADNQMARARQVNDFFWKLNSYLFLTCGCGTVLKLPPDFHATAIKCPHCGASHVVSEFKPKQSTAASDAWSDVR